MERVTSLIKRPSPFTPGVPAARSLFAGRRDEIDSMLMAVRRVAHGGQDSLFLSGEPGVGKTSAISMVKQTAEQEYGLAGFHVSFAGVTSIHEMVRKLLERVLTELLEASDVDSQREGLLDPFVQFKLNPEDIEAFQNAAAPSLRRLLKRMPKDAHGMMLIMDDIDDLAQRNEFTYYVKELVDDIAISGRDCPLLLCLLGMEESRRTMVEAVPSAGRFFHLVQLKPLSKDECRLFFEKSFGLVGFEVAPDARDLMCACSGGIPAILHEIGDATYHVDQDGHVDRKDAKEGVLEASRRVSEKSLQPEFHKKIRALLTRDKAAT